MVEKKDEYGKLKLELKHAKSYISVLEKDNDAKAEQVEATKTNALTQISRYKHKVLDFEALLRESYSQKEPSNPQLQSFRRVV